MRVRSLLLASVVAGAGALAACGGGAPLAGAPPVAQKSGGGTRVAVSDLDALEHDLAVAEQRLDHELARRATLKSDDEAAGLEGATERERATPGTGRLPREQHPTALAPALPEKKARPERDGSGEAAAASSSPAPPASSEAQTLGAPCDVACRALGSMRRSADRICGLTGDADARCAEARRRVETAAERVRTAGCACVAPT